MLRGGFPAEVGGTRPKRRLGPTSGLSSYEPGGWMEAIIHLQDIFYEAPFDWIRDAADELAGLGGAKVHPFDVSWPVLFPGFEGSVRQGRRGRLRSR